MTAGLPVTAGRLWVVLWPWFCGGPGGRSHVIGCLVGFLFAWVFFVCVILFFLSFWTGEAGGREEPERDAGAPPSSHGRGAPISALFPPSRERVAAAGAGNGLQAPLAATRWRPRPAAAPSAPPRRRAAPRWPNPLNHPQTTPQLRSGVPAGFRGDVKHFSVCQGPSSCRISGIIAFPLQLSD